MRTKHLFTILAAGLLLLSAFTTAQEEEPEVEAIEEEAPKTLVDELLEAGYTQGPEATEITYTNMKSLLQGDWVILLYTPWTPTSMELYTYLPFLAGVTGSTLRYGAVDCSLYPEVHTYFPHTGYPTLLFSRSGTVTSTYGGHVQADPLFAFAKKVAAEVAAGEHAAPEIVGNKAIDGKIEAARKLVGEGLYEYARMLRDGTEKLYVMAVNYEINPVLFTGIVGAAAVVVVIIVFLVLALCQSDLDLTEAEKRDAMKEAGERKKEKVTKKESAKTVPAAEKKKGKKTQKRKQD